ncbi:MAG: hypothetical protein DRJ03_01600 [Chloroflexi bacterium]|nr:MAG: hypothetical protein DRJ03_01600 [Chloroflexota bacterium]
MPKPKKNEKQKDFVSRCIPIVMHEGTAKDNKQAAAICNSMWREAKKEVDMPEKTLEAPEQEVKETHEKYLETEAQVVYSIPYGATSFDDVDEYAISKIKKDRVGELSRIFQTLSANILWDENIEDKETALNDLTKELQARLNDVMSDDPPGWVRVLKDKVTGIIKPKEKKEDPPQSQLMVWKDADTGQYRWMAIYSNKYRDNDNPPEILSAAAHERFVKEVEAGEQPYPELWHWHVPGTRYGVADWLHFDKETGFALASGTIDEGHEKEAEVMAAIKRPIAVSHGMPVEYIERDEKDNSVLTRYVSREISDLPPHVAANKLTGFKIVKENMMAIPEEKKEYLRSTGMSDDQIAMVEATLESRAKEASEAELEFKEQEQEQAAATETEKKDEVKEGNEFLTREEFVSTMSELMQPLVKQQEDLKTTIKELMVEDGRKVAEKAAETPPASLAALIMKEIKGSSAPSTAITDKEAEDLGKPKEKAAPENLSGDPFKDNIIAPMIYGK